MGFATMALAGAAAVALPEAAGAAPLPENCTSYTPPFAATRVVCEFDYTGAAQTFHVPDGVSELDVTAVGGQGGASSNAKGGVGAKVSGTVDVDSGTDVNVMVAGDGGLPGGGFNGGGEGGPDPAHITDYYGGGGGGASDIRTSSALDSRLIVAAGGGGGGNYRNGGDAGRPGGGDGGGQPGSMTSGGAGGGNVNIGNPGSKGVGGDGIHLNGAWPSSGGGGGGFFGGGGGGVSDTELYGGGGGGGSSLVPGGGSMTLAGEDEAPSVTISYTICTGSVCQMAGSLGNLFGSLS
ncbi:hypothetical protein GCM10023353_23820 [Tomitella cavernea]|uniref:receptor protein-tyrosine kinase n=2 Tax=Tomitella cavernea TaxID=1387982 RepID=A0ABP9CRW7_9ACTN